MSNLSKTTGKSIPTLANKIFHSFLGVCDERFFIRIYIYHSDECDSSITGKLSQNVYESIFFRLYMGIDAHQNVCPTEKLKLVIEGDWVGGSIFSQLKMGGLARFFFMLCPYGCFYRR